MPRLTADQWESVRAKREVGATFRELGAEFNISHQAIMKRSQREGWGDGSSLRAQIARKVDEKIAKVDSGNLKKRAEAIDAEAARRAAVIDKHRDEWEAARQMARAAKADHESVEDRIPADIEDPLERQQVLLAMKRAAFENLKAAKIHTETVKIVQEGERKAWGLDLIVDVTQLTDEQLAALAAGRMPN